MNSERPHTRRSFATRYWQTVEKLATRAARAEGSPPLMQQKMHRLSFLLSYGVPAVSLAVLGGVGYLKWREATADVQQQSQLYHEEQNLFASEQSFVANSAAKLALFDVYKVITPAEIGGKPMNAIILLRQAAEYLECYVNAAAFNFWYKNPAMGLQADSERAIYINIEGLPSNSRQLSTAPYTPSQELINASGGSSVSLWILSIGDTLREMQPQFGAYPVPPARKGQFLRVLNREIARDLYTKLKLQQAGFTGFDQQMSSMFKDASRRFLEEAKGVVGSLNPGVHFPLFVTDIDPIYALRIR